MSSMTPLKLGLGVAAAAGLAAFLPLIVASALVVILAVAVAPLAVAAFDARVRPAARLSPAGRAVLVTGCDTGFGRLLAERLDREGATVFAGCLTENGARDLRRKGSARMQAFVLDVTKPESVAKAVELVSEKAGSLWGVVNNAGIVRGHYVEMTDLSNFRACMEVNFFGMVQMTKGVMPLIRASGGRVVNVTSVAGRVAGAGNSVYSCSKHAAEAFSDSLRQEVPRASGVRVALVEPGFTRTPMTANLDSLSRTAYDSATAEVQEAYGGPDFVTRRAERIQHIADTMKASPEGVIEALCDALLSRVPKHRYLVGDDSLFLYPWFWRLPSFIVDPVVKYFEAGHL